MKLLKAMVGLLYLFNCYGYVEAPNLPAEGVLEPQSASFLEDARDYSRFVGRISDKDQEGRILKIKVENDTTRFFHNGDFLQFKVQSTSGERFCKGYNRGVEKNYFVMEVVDLSPCWPYKKYLRRGTVLKFYAPVLQRRVYEASKFRDMLLVKKEDFLGQLNKINNFLWNFELEKAKVLTDHEKRVEQVKNEKQQALRDLYNRKKESARLQLQLMKELAKLDESLKYYRIDRSEIMADRFSLDHDLGLPVMERPQRPVAK